ncbi:MAG: hypothetical protein KBE22_00050 [Candidatus Accumulibacter sp.]|nr:hypothetical protein [Accumulibacter sp.]
MKRPLITLEEMLPLYWQAKDEATVAAERLAYIQAAIVALMPKKDEGTVSQTIFGTKVTITYGANRTVNTSALQAAWNDITDNARSCFAWKASVAVKEMRAAQQMDAAAYYAAAEFITTTPAKPALKIERK